MAQIIEIVNPQGHVHARLSGPATAEDLLRSALRLGPQDKLLVCVVGPQEWSLAMLKDDRNLVPVGPRVPEVARVRWEATRLAMAETAWLELVDEGWSVVVVESSGAAGAVR